jgi:hypothetical protein
MLIIAFLKPPYALVNAGRVNLRKRGSLLPIKAGVARPCRPASAVARTPALLAFFVCRVVEEARFNTQNQLSGLSNLFETAGADYDV